MSLEKGIQKKKGPGKENWRNMNNNRKGDKKAKRRRWWRVIESHNIHA